MLKNIIKLVDGWYLSRMRNKEQRENEKVKRKVYTHKQPHLRELKYDGNIIKCFKAIY